METILNKSSWKTCDMSQTADMNMTTKAPAQLLHLDPAGNFSINVDNIVGTRPIGDADVVIADATKVGADLCMKIMEIRLAFARAAERPARLVFSVEFTKRCEIPRNSKEIILQTSKVSMLSPALPRSDSLCIPSLCPEMGHRKCCDDTC